MLTPIRVKQQHMTSKGTQLYFGLIEIADLGPEKMHSSKQGADPNKKWSTGSTHSWPKIKIYLLKYLKYTMTLCLKNSAKVVPHYVVWFSCL